MSDQAWAPRPPFGPLLDAALRLVDEVSDAPAAPERVEQVLTAVLYGPKDGWACFALGIITQEELCDLVASWLTSGAATRHDSAVERVCSRAVWRVLFAGLFDHLSVVGQSVSR